MDRANLLQEIADAADGLTEPYDHTERLEYWDHNRHRKYRLWKSRRPALIDQVADAAYPGMRDDSEGGGGGGHPGSRPPGDWEAIACHASISVGGVKWAVRLGIEVRDTLASNLRGLVGAAPSADSDTQIDLLNELSGWLTWAQTVAGWRPHPDTLRCPCPLLREDTGLPCAAKGSIRVRLDRKTAICLECKGRWDAATIGLLAETERAYLAATAADRDVTRLRAKADKAREQPVVAKHADSAA